VNNQEVVSYCNDNLLYRSKITTPMVDGRCSDCGIHVALDDQAIHQAQCVARRLNISSSPVMMSLQDRKRDAESAFEKQKLARTYSQVLMCFIFSLVLTI
jgi:hypothetical protein